MLIKDPKQIKSIKWEEPTVFSDDTYDAIEISIDQLPSCCGVMELGELPEGKFFDKCFINSKETVYYDTPKFQRLATQKEILSSFQQLLKNQNPGMYVCHLLDRQHNGDFGKLIKLDGWEYHGSFYNPGTRNKLHSWSKIVHKSAPKAKKSKSAFERFDD
jgi:hypothetical protein